MTKPAIDAHGAAVKHCADGPTAAPSAPAAAVARSISPKLSHLVRIWVKVRVSGVRVRVIGFGLRLARTLTLTLAPALALT